MTATTINTFPPFQAMNSPRSMPFWIYGSRFMDPIEQLAEAALQRDSLRLRSLVQDMTRATEMCVKLAQLWSGE